MKSSFFCIFLFLLFLSSAVFAAGLVLDPRSNASEKINFNGWATVRPVYYAGVDKGHTEMTLCNGSEKATKFRFVPLIGSLRINPNAGGSIKFKIEKMDTFSTNWVQSFESGNLKFISSNSSWSGSTNIRLALWDMQDGIDKSKYTPKIVGGKLDSLSFKVGSIGDKEVWIKNFKLGPKAKSGTLRQNDIQISGDLVYSGKCSSSGTDSPKTPQTVNDISNYMSVEKDVAIKFKVDSDLGNSGKFEVWQLQTSGKWSQLSATHKFNTPTILKIQMKTAHTYKVKFIYKDGFCGIVYFELGWDDSAPPESAIRFGKVERYKCT